VLAVKGKNNAFLEVLAELAFLKKKKKNNRFKCKELSSGLSEKVAGQIAREIPAKAGD
jgi:hypothetical protein